MKDRTIRRTGALVAAFLLLCTVALPTAHAQTPTVSVSVRDVTVKQLLQAIEENSQYTFVYIDSTFDMDKKVSVTARERSIESVVAEVLPDAEVQFIGTQIILRKASPKGQTPPPTRIEVPREIVGRVTDVNGDPVFGVTVLIPGTMRGTSTDSDGVYSITPGDSEELEYNCLGYKTQRIKLMGQVIVDVIMEEDRTSLDEIVVVGYGVQKRRDIVGAIETLNTKDVDERFASSMQMSRALQGAIPGLTVMFSDGKPSRDAEVHIRGAINSIGAGGSALVLMDGVEVDINNVNPHDIETVTVLKDASSTAVYGARGTFGVILLTSKTPEKGKTRITYDGAFNIYRRTVIPTYITNGYEWTTDFLEAYTNRMRYDPTSVGNRSFSFSRDWYEELGRRNGDPNAETSRVNSQGMYEYFGNTDWYNMFYAKYFYGHQHSITASGASDKVEFYVSGRFFQQDGVYRVGNEKWNQYNLTAKSTVHIKPWLHLSESLDMTYKKSHQPTHSAGNEYANPIPRMLAEFYYPVAIPKNPDGTWTNTATQGWAEFSEGYCYRDDKSFTFGTKTDLELDIIKDVLWVNADFSYRQGGTYHIVPQYTFQYDVQPGVDLDYMASSPLFTFQSTNQRLSGDATITYAPRLGNNHFLKIMVGYNIENYIYDELFIRRNGMSLEVGETPNWNFVEGENIRIEDHGSYDWGMVGAFFRVNYSYRSKYLVEASGRYDGSSKFPSNSRWGFFPSGSVGWRISEEGFMKNAAWLDNLKLRFSIGSAGNGLIADAYAYLATMSSGNSSLLSNGSSFKISSAPSPTPDKLTWESAITYDLGIDFEALDGRLNFTGDIYRKNTVNMYVVGEELPAVFGNDAPQGNYADMRSDGYELSVGWRDSYIVGGKSLSYFVKGAFWDYTSKITRYTSKTGLLPTLYTTRYYEGMTIGEIWGYECNGLFQSEEEVANSADQSFFALGRMIWSPGDPKYEDLNGDGVINRGENTIYDHGDLKIIGNQSPRYQFSFQAGINWNGIGLSFMFQGVGKRDWYPVSCSYYFWGQYDVEYGFDLPWQKRDRWSDDNRDAYWPRLVGQLSKSGILKQPNTRYLQDARYLRLKNVTVDYSFPTRIISRIGLQGLKVYFSMENPLVFTPLHKYAKNFDPEGIGYGDADYDSLLSSVGSGVGGEETGSGSGYPVLKSYTIGLSITL